MAHAQKISFNAVMNCSATRITIVAVPAALHTTKKVFNVRRE